MLSSATAQSTSTGGGRGSVCCSRAQQQHGYNYICYKTIAELTKHSITIKITEALLSGGWDEGFTDSMCDDIINTSRILAMSLKAIGETPHDTVWKRLM